MTADDRQSTRGISLVWLNPLATSLLTVCWILAQTNEGFRREGESNRVCIIPFTSDISRTREKGNKPGSRGLPKRQQPANHVVLMPFFFCPRGQSRRWEGIKGLQHEHWSLWRQLVSIVVQMLKPLVRQIVSFTARISKTLVCWSISGWSKIISGFNSLNVESTRKQSLGRQTADLTCHVIGLANLLNVYSTNTEVLQPTARLLEAHPG